MSIYYTGTFTRSGGLISAIAKQVRLVNLKQVKRIETQFDPFHPNAVRVRDFLYHITIPKVLATNSNCKFKSNVVSDRSEPWIKVHLTDEKPIKFLADNLTTLEILQQFNKHISSKAPEEDDAPLVQTKQSKKSSKRK